MRTKKKVKNRLRVPYSVRPVFPEPDGSKPYKLVTPNLDNEGSDNRPAQFFFTGRILRGLHAQPDEAALGSGRAI
jgi:hypothetical protein